jgi:hypothetical protein
VSKEEGSKNDKVGGCNYAIKMVLYSYIMVCVGAEAMVIAVLFGDTPGIEAIVVLGLVIIFSLLGLAVIHKKEKEGQGHSSTD